MPSSGIVAIDPSNNATAVIDASHLSAAPEECPVEQHETAEELSQQGEEDQPAVSPMPPHKKAPMVTPRTDRKVTTSPTAGGGNTGNVPPSSHTPEPSKGKSKKKVAVATPVAVEESSTPKKSIKRSKAKVPMRTMTHFFGKAGTVKAKKGTIKSSATITQKKKKDDKQSEKGVDTSLAEPSGDITLVEDAAKVTAESGSTAKKSKSKTKAKSKPKTKQPPKSPVAKKRAKATPTSTVDMINLEDLDDSPMDALAYVSRNMSAGRRNRVTTKSAPTVEKKVMEVAPLESGKDATIDAKKTPKTDEVVTEVEEANSSPTTADNDGKDSVVDLSKGRVEEISESDDDATVAMDDPDTPAAIESDNATSLEKDDSLLEPPVGEVECTEETMDAVECDIENKTDEKDKESSKDQPDVIFIDEEPTPETETPKKDDSTNKAEAAPSKKKRDPNAPKKPKSAWNMYQIAKRNEFKAANPETKAGDIVSVVVNMLYDDLTCDFYVLIPFDSS